MKFHYFNFKNDLKGFTPLDRKKNLTGFTLLEVTVAVLMITVGMIGVISLSLQNIQVRQVNRNILIAAQLAQEGMELVRNKRDTNWLIPTAFNTGITGIFSLDYTGTRRETPSGPTDLNSKLYLGANSFYLHGAGASTPFYRFFNVVSYANYLDVSCTVGWQEKGTPRNYIVKTLLYDWK